MTSRTVSMVVRAPPERVFQGWLEAGERFPKLYPEKFLTYKVVEQNGNERTTYCEEKWAGRRLAYTTKQRLFPPDRVEGEIIEGAGKGSLETWTFQRAAEGTRVQFHIRLRGLEGFVLGVLMRRRFDRELDQMSERWKAAIEAAA